ncbi:TIGR02281 family clan AA aspartic protease [Hyphomicrobium methylovorum]|nr:TIGR02281 family clan AA aspartic protease [Hyphomicrobium methylovorum]
MFLILVAIIAAIGSAVWVAVLNGTNLETLQGPPIAAVVVGALIVLYLLSLHGERSERRFGRLPIFLALGLAIAVAAFTLSIDRPIMLADFFKPATADIDDNPLAQRAPASVLIRKTDAGFVANGDVNGQTLTMLIDSGASTVVLKQSDAEKAGIDVSRLTFEMPLKTANGVTYLAPVRLKTVHVGQISVYDVEALVAKPGTLNENLLGMSFLRRLVSYQVAGDFVTLRQ